MLTIDISVIIAVVVVNSNDSNNNKVITNAVSLVCNGHVQI